MYIFPLVVGSNSSTGWLSLSGLLTLEYFDSVSLISFAPGISISSWYYWIFSSCSLFTGFNHYFVCIPPYMLACLRRYLLQILNIHIDLHFHHFRFLSILRFTNTIHYNHRFRFCIPFLKSSHDHLWLPLCYFIYANVNFSQVAIA